MKAKSLIIKLIGNKGDYIADSRNLGVTIGSDCKFQGMPRWGSEPWLIFIGNHVELSGNVTFITHDGATWVFRNQERYKDVIRYGKIVIEDNCFIGMNATILEGVTIGKNSIVGACSLVNKSIEPNSVYAGVPARRICSLEEYAEKCFEQSPDYDKDNYNKNKKDEVLRILSLYEDGQL